MSPEKAAIKRATQAAQRAVENLDDAARSDLARIYRQAAAEIAAAIEGYAGADGNLMLTELQSVLAQVNGQIRRLAEQRDALLGEALAQAASLGTEPVVAVLGSTAMMQVNDTALSFVRSFVAADGLQLSDRIWRLDRQARDAVSNAIEMAVIQGHGAAQAAREFLSRGASVPADVVAKIDYANASELSNVAQELMTGSGSPMDNAMRLMRTEINRAHGTAYMIGAGEHPDVVGFRYLLSPAHPAPDICDLLSTQNLYGLGDGVYPKDKIDGVWPAHPNTLSFVVAVFKDEVTEADRAGKETPMQTLERLSPDQLQGVLGVNKHEAYKQGKITQGMIKSPWKAVSQRIEKMNMEDTRDALTRQYFSGKTISVTGMTSVARFGGMGITEEVIAPLSGALDGSRVHVKARAGGLYIEARHELFDRPVTWQLGKDGILHGIEMYLSPDAPSGLGTRMMATTVFTAQALGLKEIQIMAAGKPDNGYYTWPRLGFDARLSAAEQRILERAGFNDVKTVLDVMQTEKGRDWWRTYGTQREMFFPLDADGRSVQTLTQYLNERGVIL